MVNKFPRLTRFHMITCFDNANYKISIPNANQEFVTINFEFQVTNLKKKSFNSNSLIIFFMVHLQFHRTC